MGTTFNGKKKKVVFSRMVLIEYIINLPTMIFNLLRLMIPPQENTANRRKSFLTNEKKKAVLFVVPDLTFLFVEVAVQKRKKIERKR